MRKIFKLFCYIFNSVKKKLFTLRIKIKHKTKLNEAKTVNYYIHI